MYSTYIVCISCKHVQTVCTCCNLYDTERQVAACTIICVHVATCTTFTMKVAATCTNPFITRLLFLILKFCFQSKVLVFFRFCFHMWRYPFSTCVWSFHIISYVMLIRTYANFLCSARPLTVRFLE